MFDILTQQDSSLRNFTNWMTVIIHNDIVTTISFFTTHHYSSMVKILTLPPMLLLDKCLELLLNLKPAANFLYNIILKVLHLTKVYSLICWSSCSLNVELKVIMSVCTRQSTKIWCSKECRNKKLPPRGFLRFYCNVSLRLQVVVVQNF